MIYFRLLDELNKDEIIKQESLNNEYQYVFGDEKWVRTSVMTKYRQTDSPEYGKFEEISESDALALLDMQRINLKICLLWRSGLLQNLMKDSSIRAESRI